MFNHFEAELTQEQIARVKEFYNPQVKYDGIELTIPGRNKFFSIRDYESQVINPVKPCIVYLTFGVKCSSEEEALAVGAIKTTDKELAKAFAPDLFQSIQGSKMDKRSSAYLKDCKQDLQLVAIEHGWDGIAHDVEKSISIWLNTSEVEIGKVTEGKYTGKYIATYSVQISVDDYDITSLIFEKEPKKEEIQTARLLERAEDVIIIKRKKPVFKCKECGKESHWLDIPGTVKEKVDFLGNAYCNHC